MTTTTTKTQRSEDPSEVMYVLEMLHKRQQEIEQDDWVAKEMITHLKKKLNMKLAPFLASANYKLVGSAAEKISVSKKDDKDILLVLGQPYTPEYFKSEYEADGRHFLKWNQKYYEGKRPRYVGQQNFLSSLALRTFVNTCLETALKGQCVGNLQVSKVEVWKQAVRTHLRSPGGRQTYIVDIIPQIRGAEWTKVDGVVPLENVGASMHKTITTMEAAGESCVMFSLFGPAGTTAHTFSTCYALLERDFFLNNDGLRDLALLAKVILTGHNWKKKFGLKVVHFKRLIMAESERFRSISTWQALILLLSIAEVQLRKGSLDGFPDHDCDIMWSKTDRDCRAMSRAMTDTLMTLDPHYFTMYLP